MSRYTGPILENPGDGEAGIIIYGYVPSLILGAIGAATFALAFGVHFWHTIRGKGVRTFQLLVCVCCAMEVVGYVFRIRSHSRPFVVISFVLQYFMIVCAPVFFTTAIFLALSETLARLPNAREILRFSRRIFLAVFVTIDAVCTVAQVAGAALIGVSQSAIADGRTPPISSEAANNILLAGLAIQAASFLLFLTALALIIFRAKKLGTPLPKKLTIVLSVTSLLIFLRTLYRLAETAEGFFGEASTNEVLFAILEFVPVILAVGIWGVFPLKKILPTVMRRDGDGEKHEMA